MKNITIINLIKESFQKSSEIYQKNWKMILPVAVIYFAIVYLPDLSKKPDNHSIVVGDMFTRETKAELRKKLGSDKVDILIERLVGGHSSIPLDENWLFINLNNWYGLLNEGGVMFVESPIFNDSPKTMESYQKWISQIMKENKDNIEIQNELREFQYFKQAYLRLRKLPGAPANLPRLENTKVEK